MTLPTRHVENVIVPGRRLGRRAPNPLKQQLQLKLTGVVPTHPATADHFSKITNWGMLGNDKWGDCGPAAVAHYVMLVTEYLTGAMVTPTLNDVLALYTLCNPDFNPATGAGDNGVDMGEMLGYVCTEGIGGKVGLAHATVDISNIDDVRAVISIFGGALLGVTLETAQETQTNNGGPWDYSPSRTWGGHAVLGGLYTSNTARGQSDISVVTWGDVMGTTDAFDKYQLQEAHVLIFEEHLGSVAFQQGVDVAALAADYQALTGQKFPVVPSPTPTPTPPPAPTPIPVSPADQALAAAIPASWLDGYHVGGNETVCKALQAWFAGTGLTPGK